MEAAGFAATRALRVRRQRVRWFFAGLLGAIGAVDVVEAFVVHHPLRDRTMEALLPTSVTEGSRTAVVISGLALLLLARGMARGKRVAWWLTSAVLGTSAGLHLVKDLDFEQALLAAWVLLGLWWLRSDFQAGSDPAALRRGALALAAGVGLAVLEAEIGSLLLHNELRPRVGAAKSLEQLALAWLGGSVYQPLSERSAWFLGSLPWVSGFLVLIGLIQLLRPAAARAAAAPAEVDRARRLARRWGRNPIAWLATAPENAFCWAGERAFVAYRLSGKVALALGDPVGPSAERASALEAFLQLCDERDWTPAFYQVQEETPYRQRGQTLLPIGSDGIVRVADFSLEGGQSRDLRYASRRCQREGISFAFLPGDQAWELAAEELTQVSARWLSPERGPELGFSLGRLDSLDDPAVTIATARSQEGDLLAFVSWLPASQGRGWTLDLMRRIEKAPYGVMEALVAKSILEARERGLAELSLGLIVDLEGCGLKPPAHLGPVYGWLAGLDRNRSLRSFKAKFAPRWEPRYLAVPDLAALPAVLTALGRVHLQRLPRLSIAIAMLRRYTHLRSEAWRPGLRLGLPAHRPRSWRPPRGL